VNNKNIIIGFCLAGWMTSLLFSAYLYNTRDRLSKDNENLKDLVLSSKSTNSNELNEDLEKYRQQGKVDGKIEAILMMNNVKMNLSEEDAERVIQSAESANGKDLETNNSFLTLLSQAAYHKGLNVGFESAKKDSNQQFEDGYHKAIEDFTCPETGKIIVPPKKEIDMKKP
jgi:hypothetical protein